MGEWLTSTLCHLHGFPPLHHYHCTHTLFPLLRHYNRVQLIKIQTNHSPVGPHINIDVVHPPFSPRFLRVRSMWSLSWIRTWRSVGWSRINECLSSCSVDGRLGYVFTRHPSMKSMNFLDLWCGWIMVDLDLANSTKTEMDHCFCLTP